MSIYSIRLYPEPNPDGQFNVTSPDVPGRSPKEIRLKRSRLMHKKPWMRYRKHGLS